MIDRNQTQNTNFVAIPQSEKRLGHKQIRIKSLGFALFAVEFQFHMFATTILKNLRLSAQSLFYFFQLELANAQQNAP